eukprot:scaffold87969_cov31-Tisochrysis_lutea.AAC.5
MLALVVLVLGFLNDVCAPPLAAWWLLGTLHPTWDEEDAVSHDEHTKNQNFCIAHACLAVANQQPTAQEKSTRIRVFAYAHACLAVANQHKRTQEQEACGYS